MSFFYISPVIGEMPVHVIDTIVTKRLEYLKSIFKGNLQEYNEYVVEGSIYDNVGHFMLCIVVVLAENTDVIHFFLKTELELFRRRLFSLTAYDLRCFAKKLLRGIRKYDSTPTFTEPLQVICRHLLVKDIAQHVSSSTHTGDCFKHTVSLNFKHCLPLIAKRQVELQNGIVHLPCGKWKQYLTHLFTTNMKYKLSRTNLTELKSDPRILEITNKIKLEFPISKEKTGKLLSREIDAVSKMFPPCMMNLHEFLRKKHRLSHSQRFYYSLFLKDIGMPVNEAIDFWSKEYKQSPNNHACCHDWGKDEKRYLYGMRHMYGLEGCRKNYTSVNCQRIQNSDSSCSEGGCPFKSFDNNKMLHILNTHTILSDSDVSQINEFKRRSQYTSACVYYLQKSLKVSNCDSFTFNFTPVKYFTYASKIKSVELSMME